MAIHFVFSYDNAEQELEIAHRRNESIWEIIKQRFEICALLGCYAAYSG